MMSQIQPTTTLNKRNSCGSKSYKVWFILSTEIGFAPRTAFMSSFWCGSYTSGAELIISAKPAEQTMCTKSKNWLTFCVL